MEERPQLSPENMELYGYDFLRFNASSSLFALGQNVRILTFYCRWCMSRVRG